MAETVYQLRHVDTAGSPVAVYDHWRRLSYFRRVNRAGGCELELYGGDDRVSYFELDSLLEVWRRYPGGDWYQEFPVLHRNAWRAIRADGDRAFTSYSRGLLDLLARRILLGFAGTGYTGKAAVAETVFKEFVSEQAVAGAIFREIAGLTVEADGAGGNAITISRAWRNLLEVLQEFAGDVAGGDISVETNGAAAWLLEWHEGQLGEDRTWGNAAGNPPVVFSLAAGTLRLPTYGVARAGEINVAYVGGKRKDTDRMLVERTDAAAIADSPLNRCEAFRGATQETTTAGLNARGDALLDEGQAQETLSFEIVQTPALVYGRDFSLGDLVTFRFEDIEVDKKLTGVRVSVDYRGEAVTVETADVP